MGLLDDIKAAADNHEDKVEQVIDKVGETVSDRTDGKFDDKVEQAMDLLKDKIGNEEA